MFPAKSDRRSFFGQVATGLGTTALLQMLGEDVQAEPQPTSTPSRRQYTMSPRTPHFVPRATSVIQLFMNGGPSQMDLFDPKPELDKNHGKPFFENISGEVENPAAAGALMRSAFGFRQRGQCGMWVSDALPHLAQCVDEITLIRSMHTPNLTHEPALYMAHSGNTLPGLPSMGSWVTYGLGSLNQDLPGYVVLDDPRGLPINRSQNWQSGYLPPVYQGTRFRSTGSPVLNLQREFEEPDLVTRLERKLIGTLDRIHQQGHPAQQQLAARIASYELAARMQMSATDALDLSRETTSTLNMYGLNHETTESYGRRCLYARRLVERGVRYVQLFIDSQIWDNHTTLNSSLKTACDRTDKPIAGLLKDLKQRGLLDSTLVVWGGEMGRLPIAQLPGDKDEKKAGRDHNKNAMVCWMAGGGIKCGYTHGATDELGFAAVEDRVSVSDWHATILHLLGMDHEQLFFRRNGLKEKLTGVNGARVVRKIIA
ncbi:MAG: DUF1501 domain-containing protein [Pirellulaceae bacterium]